MNIFDHAMSIEQEGEKYYRDLANSCGDTGLARIFNQLADSELDHYAMLKHMRDNVDPELVETNLLEDAKNIFVEMAKESGDFDFNLSEIEAYKKAIEHESEAAAFYSEQAKKAENDTQRKVLETLAQEELDHVKILQNIIDFVSAPDSWMEDAEWSSTSAR